MKGMRRVPQTMRRVMLRSASRSWITLSLVERGKPGILSMIALMTICQRWSAYPVRRQMEVTREKISNKEVVGGDSFVVAKVLLGEGAGGRFMCGSPVVLEFRRRYGS